MIVFLIKFFDIDLGRLRIVQKEKKHNLKWWAFNSTLHINKVGIKKLFCKIKTLHRTRTQKIFQMIIFLDQVVWLWLDILWRPYFAQKKEKTKCDKFKNLWFHISHSRIWCQKVISSECDVKDSRNWKVFLIS